mmetsp:Transcript_13870/g.11853  ORF Transcript_13870/g.11853 Transcript_13870/m.11853 type:complete len:117 (-) Transcript_13870:331-681(-)
MQAYIKDSNLIEDIFNSIDIEKEGRIDFRDFICALSIIKGGTLEDKLRLAFLAYDSDHNGFIDKNELSRLLRASAFSKGLLIDDKELRETVDRVFPLCDQNNDGKLSFTEFKNAVF